MKIIKYAAMMGGLVGLMAGSGCLPHSTDTNEIGVKYCKFWCGADKVEVVPSSTTLFFAPVKNDWYTLSREMQSFYMTKDPNTGDRARRDDEVFKTKEGNNIGQDVVVTWKIDPSKAAMIIEQVGPDIEAIKEKYVRPLARSIVRDYFNKLQSNEFYESQRRFEEAKNATVELKERLAPYGIIIDTVNPKDYRFEDKNYQVAINDAKNAGQDKEKFGLQKKSAEEEWKKRLEQQRGISNETIAQAEGFKKSTIHQANAAYEEKMNQAASIVAEKKAEAKGITKLREAMASRGGDTAI